MTDWLLSTLSSTIVTTALVGFLLFFLRNLILTRLKASVEHEFNDELEKLRADLRKSEEAFRADLRAREAQIEVLRSGALSGLTSRQALLDQRRLQAVEELWEGIGKLASHRVACVLMTTVDFEKSLKTVAQEPNVREFFTKLATTIGVDKWPKMDVQKCRPFVSEIAWALFFAYQAIVGHAVSHLQLLRFGVDKPDILNEIHVPKLVKAASPWCAEYVDKYGPAGFYQLLEPLEAELLKELQRMLRGEDSDVETINRAAKILAEAKKVDDAIPKVSIPPTISRVEVAPPPA